MFIYNKNLNKISKPMLMSHRITVFSLVFLSVFGLILTGCKKDDKIYKKVRLNIKETEENIFANNPQKNPLRLAVAPVISTTESFGVYNDMIEYIGRKLQRSAIFIQGSNYAEINNLVRYRHCDAAFVCDYAYIQGKKDFGMEILAVPEVNGKAMYQSYIIVQSKSKIKNFWDLEGKSFAFADPLSSTGFLYPRYLLKTKGKTPETFFSKTIFTYGHDNSIKAVSQGIVDGAAVDSLVFNFMVANKNTYKVNARIVNKSPYWPSPPVVINPAIEPKTRSMLKSVLLSMHKDKEGKSILSRLMIDRFVIVKDKEYDSIRKMAMEIGY